MLHVLRRHPFAVEALFRRSLVVTYAFPKEVLLPLIGPGLALDTYDERWGFLAIALVETVGLRPKGLPAWLGRDFFLSGYRIFTRFVRPGKPSLRGLKILRSDTDRASMATLGNLFTHYHYARADVTARERDGSLDIRIGTAGHEADLRVVADLASRPAPLPQGSPFRSLEDARHFAGPLPYTFDFERETGKMVVIKGLRTAWDPVPVRVTVHEATFLERGPFAGASGVLANAFYLEGVPYAWKPGVLEAFP
jgi:hypothetical protein